jgi:glycosyltransferase involved in cell wall biosynthesis
VLDSKTLVGKEGEIIKILFIANSMEGTLKYRVNLPAKYLGADIAVETNVMSMQVKIYVNILGKMQSQIKSITDYNIVVFQYANDPDLIFLIKRLNKLGIKTVIDLDDDLVNSNPYYLIAKETTKGIIEAIKLVDLVTVTTESLAETYSQYNANVIILPNMIEIDEWNFPKRDPSFIIAGWYSSGIRFEEMNEILAGRIPEDVFLYFAGSDKFKEFKHERKMVEDRFNPADTPRILSNIDIGLIPLSLCKFNNGKSDLKGLEYGAMSIPFIASPTDPYKKLIDHCVNGFLAKHGRDWTKYINMLVSDSEMRLEMGKAARKVSESRDIAKNINLWEEAYEF